MWIIIFSYTVQAMEAIMVLLRDRGTAPLKKPCRPCSWEGTETEVHSDITAVSTRTFTSIRPRQLPCRCM